MAKQSMKSFREKRSKEKSEKTEEQVEVAAKEKSVASPMLSGGSNRSRTATVKKAERKLMKMPITKDDIELTVMSVDPSECVIHPKNRRIQKLLRESNPKIMDLKKSIEEEGQRDPVLARFVEVDGERKVEVIDGSRRRFASELIRKDEPEFKLKVWIGKGISDVDAEYLTKVENEFQEAISAWETAVHLKSVAEKNPDWSQEALAINEGMAQQSVSEYLQLAMVPMQIVETLLSPDCLALRSGKQLVKMFEGVESPEIAKKLKKVAANELFESSDTLLKSLKEEEAKKAISKPTANKKIEIKSGKKVRAEIGKNRKVDGQYKVDVYDVTDTEYEELIESINKIFKR